MILPLGRQNAFVMNQGIRRQYHIMIALLCAISDLVLIARGFLVVARYHAVAVVAGAGHLGRRSLLLWYGFWRF
ncbi:LysE family transporter [Escherichia coli]